MKFSQRLSQILIGSLLGVLIIPAIAFAQSANSAQGMQISPTLVEINAELGGQYKVSVNVTNVTASDLFYSASVDDFEANSETGSPNIVSESSLPENASVKTWVSSITGFTLASHDSKDIQVQINVPMNAEPGGHYGIVRFSGSTPDVSSNGVGLSASAGVLLLIRVGSDDQIVEQAELAEFFTQQNDSRSWFFENGPIDFVTRIQNKGNVHVKPSGSIEVRDMFGGLTSKIDINTQNPKSNVLPDSIRRFDSELTNQWMFGQYTATLTMGYGTKGQAITNTIKFWVVPYKLILVVLLVIFTIGFVLKRMVIVYNRHIIEKSKNEKNKKGNKK